jgi:hypothetical protein
MCFLFANRLQRLEKTGLKWGMFCSDLTFLHSVLQTPSKIIYGYVSFGDKRLFYQVLLESHREDLLLNWFLSRTFHFY